MFLNIRCVHFIVNSLKRWSVFPVKKQPTFSDMFPWLISVHLIYQYRFMEKLKKKSLLLKNANYEEIMVLKW